MLNWHVKYTSNYLLIRLRPCFTMTVSDNVELSMKFISLDLSHKFIGHLYECAETGIYKNLF